MKKFFAIAVLLASCMMLNAQLSVTRNGQHKYMNQMRTFILDIGEKKEAKERTLLYTMYNPNWCGSTIYDDNFDDNLGSRKNKVHLNDWPFFTIPKYTKGLKSVAVTFTEIIYDFSSEEWTENYKSDEPTYFYYDENGRLSSSEWSGIKRIYEYNGGKVTKIDDDSFIYDKNGFLNKIKNKAMDVEYHIFWNQQGYLSRIDHFYKGNKIFTRSFQVTENGTNILLLSAKGTSFRRIILDKNGLPTKLTDYNSNITEGLDNEYDKKGNLVKQLHYKMTDLGKRYDMGYILEYEYDDIEQEQLEEEARLEQLEQERIEEEERLEQERIEAEQRKEAEYNELLKNASEAERNGRYYGAWSNYRNALSLFPERNTEEITRKMNRCDANNQIQLGDNALNMHSYDYARNHYNSALTYGDTAIIRVKLAKVDEMEEFDRERKEIVYDYDEINFYEYMQAKKIIKNKIYEYAEKNIIGSCTVTVNYCQDLSGAEKKEISVSPSNSDLELYLNHYAPSLPVCKEHGLNLQTKALFEIKVDGVRTQRYTARSTVKGIKSKIQVPNTLKLPMSDYGKYTLERKMVSIEGDQQTSVRLLEYKNTGGPANAWLSLLVPGLGLHKVTYGKRTGLFTTIGVYGLIGTGVGLYLGASNHPSNAKTYRTWSYVSFSAAGVWWLYDILRVAVLGKANVNKYGKHRAYVAYTEENNGVGLGYTLNF